MCTWMCHCLLVYLGDDDSPSEPDFQYTSDTPSLASVGGDPLTASMTLLKDGLDTGTTVAQFEVLFFSSTHSLNNISLILCVACSVQGSVTFLTLCIFGIHSAFDHSKLPNCT